MRGRKLQPWQVSEVNVPLFDTDRFPPPGTMCADCLCCRAGIYAGEGELRVAICIACDEGTICAPKQRMLDAAATEQVFPQASEPEPAQPQPAEPDPVEPAAPEPLPEKTMPEFCKGGCGTELPKTNKSGFAWGHKTGCPAASAPETSEAEPEAEVEAAPEVSINFTDAQLDRIWFSLPIEEKALAIQTALSAERE